MKYLIEYKIRNAGLTYEQNIANGQALLTAFGKWKPDDGLNVQAFLSKIAGAGGYVLVEADDAKLVQSFVAKFNFWNDIEVIPVNDISEAVPAAHAALNWAGEAAKG